MRCLPDSVLEINDLPKRRIFHFPGIQYEAALKQVLIDNTVALSDQRSEGYKHSFEALADDIDALDSKLTYGLLMVGGAAALVTPLVGAGIAANALWPGIAGLANKYGLRPFGQKLSKTKVENEAKMAEQKVIQQFSESSTVKVVTPIL